jgi:hemoglobin-like flavoprotein
MSSLARWWTIALSRRQCRANNSEEWQTACTIQAALASSMKDPNCATSQQAIALQPEHSAVGNIMTPRQIALVREGFDLIAPSAEAVGLAFYAKLFELDPSLRGMFAQDLRPQADHLMTALTLVVRALHDLTPVLGRIQMLGRNHVGYGVKAEHFDTVGAAFLATLQAGLGDALTEEARAAWGEAYNVLANAMIAEMDTPPAAAA